MTLPVLRLLADDLTGALDTAAEFAALCGPVPVSLDGAAPPGSAALTTGTREATRDEAIARTGASAGRLRGADIAFTKIDSLLRGHPAAQLAACLGAGAWRSIVLAPAFPAQGRVTRSGRQYAAQPGGVWRQVGAPLPELLGAEGLTAAPGDPDAPLPPGISLFDAGTEEEMHRIAACGRAAPGPVLWCGSGGLGRALAAQRPARADPRLTAPLLGLIGSDQAVALRQAEACGTLHLAIAMPDEAPRVAALLARHGAAIVTCALPPATQRPEAAARIVALSAALTTAMPRPATLLAAGGETLAAICATLGATALEAIGLLAPGVPRSRLLGGRWDGIEVVSKSGAFGGDDLWRGLLAQNGFISERRSA